MHSLSALIKLTATTASGIFFVFAAQAAQTVVIGHAANFSDVSKSAINPYNAAVSNGLKFAIDEFRAELVNRDIEVRIQNFDYGNSEIKALEAAKAIVASKAVAAIGFYESGQSLLGSPILEKAHLPLISPMSSASRLFGRGPHFHSMSFSNTSMGGALAKFAAKKFKAKSALVVTAADCAYCTDLGGAFIFSANSHGLVSTKVDVLNELLSFESLERTVKGKRFDVVVVPNHELASAKIIAHLLKLGVKGPFIGGDGWGNAQGKGFFQIVTDKSFEGYCVGHWHPQMATEVGRQFARAWQKEYGELPSADSAVAYDSMRHLLRALLRTKGKNITRQSVQASLAGIKHYNGATGNLAFNGSGQPPNKPLLILKSDMSKRSFVPTTFGD